MLAACLADESAARLHHAANTAAMGVRARQLRAVTSQIAACLERRRDDLTFSLATASRRTSDAPLLRRGDTNGDQGGIRSTRNGAAGGTSFAEELRLIASRSTIGRDQDFIVLALHRASRDTVGPNGPDAWAGRTEWTSFTLRTRRPRGAGRTDRTGIPLGPRRAGRTCIALRALAAGGQTGKQGHCQHQMRSAHCHILRARATAPLLEDQTRQLDARTHARKLADALAPEDSFVYLAKRSTKPMVMT
jgi:hypothetical protein